MVSVSIAWPKICTTEL